MGWQGRGLGAKGEGIVAPVSGGRRSPYHPRAAPIPNPNPNQVRPFLPRPRPHPQPTPTLTPTPNPNPHQVRPFFLDLQYRAHPKLAEFPADMIYGGRLRSGVTAQARRP